MMTPVRLCHTLIACLGGVARLASALTISIPPRPVYSGSVQPILSTMLTHAGQNPIRWALVLSSKARIVVTRW